MIDDAGQADLDTLAAHLDGALIASDFDGTLAPIVPDPAAARPVAGVVDSLNTLADCGAQIAIVSGRDIATVLELGNLKQIPGLIVSGLHGAEYWAGGDIEARDEPPGLDHLRRVLPKLIEPYDGVWLEDKRLSLVVHARRAADPDGATAALTDPVTELAAANGLDMIGGKQVLEIRIPQLSKADAVKQLLATERTAALFAGDDLGDLPAFAAIDEWTHTTGRPGLTIGVGDITEVQRSTRINLAEPADFAAALASLAAS